jgi:PilZ domain
MLFASRDAAARMNNNLDQRRRTERVQFRGTAHLRAAGEPEGLSAEVHNLSAHGMFVRAPRVPAPGSDVACHVFLNDESCVFTGKIAWARNSNTPIPEAGIEFVDLSQSDRTVLERVLVRPDGPMAIAPALADITERIELSPTTVSRNSATGLYGVAGGLLGLGLLWSFGRSGENPTPTRPAKIDVVSASRPQVSPLAPSTLMPEKKREVPFGIDVGASSTVIRIAYRGSDRDAQVYRLVDPMGVAARLPMARVPASEQGHFSIGRDGVRHVWVEMREGVLHVRVLPESGSKVSAVIRDGQIVATVDRTPVGPP